MGGVAVDGELLAAPFVVAGMAAVTGAILEQREYQAVAVVLAANAGTGAGLS